MPDFLGRRGSAPGLRLQIDKIKGIPPEFIDRCSVNYACLGWEGHHEEATIFCDHTRWKKVFCSEKDLPESCARQIFGSLPRYLAPMICSRAYFNYGQPLFIVVHTGDDFGAAVEQIELFRDQHPGGRIAIVADHYQLGELVSAFRAGANGYFVDMTCDVFIKSMELVMMGETIFPPAFLSFVLDPEGALLGEAAPRDENNQAIPSGPRTFRAAAFRAGEINPALPDRRRLQQMDSAKDQYRRGDREGPRQGDPSQDPGPESDTGSDLGDEQRDIDTTGKHSQCGSKQLPKPVEVLSEIKQIGASVPLGAIEQEANNVDVSRIDPPEP